MLKRFLYTLLFISAIYSQNETGPTLFDQTSILKMGQQSSIYKEVFGPDLFVDSILIARLQLTVVVDPAGDWLSLGYRENGLTVGMPLIITRDNYDDLVISRLFKSAMKEKTKKHLEARYKSIVSGSTFKFGTNVKFEAFESLFGSSEVALIINGNITVNLSGQIKDRSGQTNSLQADNADRLEPQLDVEQSFVLEGKIGDKLTIIANQDSRSQQDFENVIRVHYKGYDDEIIQSIDAGNIDLSLPGTQFVRSSGGQNKGLFGIKSQLQFGDIHFTGIASVEKGQKVKLSIKNGKVENSNTVENPEIKDFEYIKYRFFFVDSVFRNNFERSLNQVDKSIFPARSSSALETNLIIQDLDVFVEADNNDQPSDKRWSTAISGASVISEVDTTINPTKEGKFETLQFRKLENGIDYSYNQQLGFFWLKSNYNKTIAISYRVVVRDPNISNHDLILDYYMSDDTWNQFASDKPELYKAYRNDPTNTAKFLKLIKSKNMSASQTNKPIYKDLEKLHMKNVYNFGYKRDDKVKVKIYRDSEKFDEPEEYSGITYNAIFGLDNLNESVSERPNGGRGDREFDYSNNSLFESTAGQYLIFPYLQPFEPSDKAVDLMGLIKTKDDQSFTWNRDYDSEGIYSYVSAPKTSKYQITIEGNFNDSFGGGSGNSGENKISLDFGIIEGSERVTINSVTMKRGTDYNINYFSGILTLVSPRALLGKDDMEIEYEKQNFLQLDQKTLLGGRVEYKINPDAFIGATALYLRKSSLDEKVRIGSEPFENFIWDINGSYKTDAEFLTEAVNYLPGINTSAASAINMEAEFAQNFPNPNTKNNEKLNDNNGVAYIDDFESAKRASGISTNRIAWRQASAPLTINGEDVSPKQADSTRTQLAFFNPYNLYQVTNIIDKNVSAKLGNSSLQLLNLAIRKKSILYDNNGNEVNIQNQGGQFVDVVPKTPGKKAWAGVMASNVHNGDITNTRFLEIWVRWDYKDKTNLKPVLNIDFGNISEDFYTDLQVISGLASQTDNYQNNINFGRNIYSTEDISDGFSTNTLEDNEDVGLDRMSDEEEVAIYGIPNPFDNWQNMRQTDITRSAYFANVNPTLYNPDGSLTDELIKNIPWQINGTEKNSDDVASGAYPDQEDIDRDGSFDTQNNYFHVEIPISNDPDEIRNNKYFSTFGRVEEAGWVQFRIPIKKLVDEKAYYPSSSIPSFTNVDFIRVYVDRIDEMDDEDVMMVNMASIEFVGSDWQTIAPKKYDDIIYSNNEIGVESDVIKLSFLNTEENTADNADPKDNYASYYIPPAGAQGDYVDAERTVRGKEQSLVLEVNDLKSGERAELYKSSKFITSKLSFHKYKKLKFFMRSHNLGIYSQNSDYALPRSREEFKQPGAHRNYFYLKFGIDSKSFYEYRIPITVNAIDSNLYPLDKDNKTHQELYWEDGRYEIDLDLFSVAKESGLRERFSGTYDAYYIYENPEDTLMERYRVVGAPDITNINYISFGVHNANNENNNNRPLTSKIWINEFRATDVRKESGSALRFSLNTRIADVATFSASFLNRDADFKELNDINSSPITSTTESQRYNFLLNIDKFFPNSSGLKFPLNYSVGKSISIPKFIPGTDIRTFYQHENFADRIKHLFGFGDFDDRIKNLYSLNETATIGFSVAKNRTTQEWYNHFIFDNLSYDAKFGKSHVENYQLEYDDSYNVSHNLGYNFQWSKENYIEPFSWLGDGEWIDKISKVKFYYSPSRFSTSLNLTQKESEKKRRENDPDDPTFIAEAQRKVALSYNITDELSADISRDYKSKIDIVDVDGEQMTITDVFKNLVTNPFQRNAVGDDKNISNKFTLSYKPVIIEDIQTSYSYNGVYSYREDINNPIASLSNSKTLDYKIGVKPGQSLSKLFGGEGSTGRTPSRGRGRGRPSPKTGENRSQSFLESNNYASSTSLFNQDPKKSAGIDIALLNPLVWGKELLLSWSSLDVNYQTKRDNSSSLNQQLQPDIKYQLALSGISNVPFADSVGGLFSYSRSRTIGFKNSFNFGRAVSISFDNSYTFKTTPKSLGKESNNDSYTFFSVDGDIDTYGQFYNNDSVGGSFYDNPIGVLIPNWSVSISGVEKWPLIGLIANTAKLSHSRNGQVTTGYNKLIENDVNLPPIESYTYSYSNNYSPMVKIDMTHPFDIRSSFSYITNYKVNFTSTTAGSKTEKEDYLISMGYTKKGGFKLPDFWPFNGKFIDNNISFQFTLKSGKSNSYYFKSDPILRINKFVRSNYQNTLSIDPSISYSFNKNVTGNAYYGYSVTESNRIKKLTINKFGFKVNLQIQN